MVSGSTSASNAAIIVAQAANVSGAIIKMDSGEFQKLLNQINTETAVAFSEGGMFKKKFKYLMNDKGLFVFTNSDQALQMNMKTELIKAKNIWNP